MRTIPANTLIKLAEQYGNEPINIVVVSWDRIRKYWYADRELDGIHGKILIVSNMDTVINVSGSSDSEEISIVLDDTNGEIKTLMDNNDVHKVNAWVYQYFYGMDLDDKFLLFKGKVNSPIVWSEGNRRVSFNIVSQLEDNEVGFSPEEGQFLNIADELIGRPWPMIFGSVTGSRALRITRVGAAITSEPIYIPDSTLQGRVAALHKNYEYQRQRANELDAEADYELAEGNREKALGNDDAADAHFAKQASLIDLANSARLNSDSFKEQELSVLGILLAQESAGTTSSVGIINQDSPIPTGNIIIRIGGALFTGVNYGSRIHFNRHTHGWRSAPWYWSTASLYGYVPRELTDEPLDLPRAIGKEEKLESGHKRVMFDGQITGSSLGYFQTAAGSAIAVLTNESQQYIVSITPGTVTRVSAYYSKDGLRVLTVIPSDYYTVSTVNYGSVTAVVITTTDALSKLGSWEDQIYVDFVSTVGPNTVEIMEYLIDNYSDLTYDTTTFNSVKTALANYPSNFVIYNRRNLLDLLKDIAWQCRCSIKLVNDIFYLTYLSTTPASIETIDNDDIEIDSLELNYTQTEDLVTKMNCTWESSGFQKEKHRVILKNNVAKYGIQEQDYDFYIYNYIDAIIKSATFWLIRYSNTWRKATFITPITKLNIETLDAVTLDVSFISSSSITSIVESAIYDSANNGISFECWLPILAGTTSEYIFAFPASAGSTEIFQADVDVPQLYSIGTTIINQNRTTNDPFRQGTRRYNTLGSKYPSDVGDVEPNLTSRGSVPFFTVLSAAGPDTPFWDDVELLAIDPPAGEAISEIDIHTTTITDSSTGKSCNLDTFFDRIADVSGSDVLIVSATHSVVGEDDDTNEQIAQFHYRYYSTGTTWGAGTAFLRA